MCPNRGFQKTAVFLFHFPLKKGPPPTNIASVFLLISPNKPTTETRSELNGAKMLQSDVPFLLDLLISTRVPTALFWPLGILDIERGYGGGGAGLGPVDFEQVPEEFRGCACGSNLDQPIFTWGYHLGLCVFCGSLCSKQPFENEREGSIAPLLWLDDQIEAQEPAI